MAIDINKSDIRLYYNNEAILKKTAEQVIKDFAMFGYQIEFSGDIRYVYDELFEQLLEHISHLLSSDMEKLFNLLYRIDLNERTIQKASKENEDTPLDQLVTRMILQRELKKVLFREYYKQKDL